MKERLQIVVATMAVFLCGLLVGVWTQRTPPIPPPPMRVMGEFRRPYGEMFPSWLGEGSGETPMNPAEMQSKIAALRPQFEAFHDKVRTIERTFRSQFEQILKPDQKAHLLDLIAKHDRRWPGVLPGCAGEMGHPFVTMVIYRPVLERLTAKLSLDETQQAQLTALLIKRREQLLDLVDSTPPPSFQLGSMVPSSGEK
jgi:hypothetical protein